MPKFVFKDDTGKEREFEVGMDEAYKVLNASVWPANVKRMFDEYMDLGLGSARSQQKLADRIGENSENHSEELRKLSVQHLQNAVQNQDFAAKGYLERINGVNAHVWANIDTSSDAFVTLLASKIASELNKEE